MKQLVVTLGASAGGLSALESFFSLVPEKTDVSFVIVQHLSPNFKSLMSELLAAHTQLPIRKVHSGLEIEPGHVYLIPAGCLMTIKDGTFELRPRSIDKMPINVFMESLAEERGGQAIGIVLSGTGSDGTIGCKAIRDAKGLVIAQEPMTAEFSSMPESVIRSNIHHFIRAPQDMWSIIKHYTGSPEACLKTMEEIDPSDAFHTKEATLGYSDLFALLRRLYQIDFSQYKITSVSRRIERRVGQSGSQDVVEYFEHISKNKKESDALYQDLLIGVTEFMRDTEAYKELAEKVIRPVMAGANRPEEFRVWVAGCASGQEAYSVLMLTDEIARETNYDGKISLFATDIHKRSTEEAGLGIYSKEAVASLSPERLERYFSVTESGNYRIKPFLRQRVVFAPHNLLVDPPFTRMDLVTCRNLLIYLKPTAQESVLRSLHYALNMGGALFLGSSESLGNLEDLFHTLSGKAKIYRKQSELKSPSRPRQLFSRPIKKAPQTEGYAPKSTSTVSIDRDLLHAYDLVLKRYAPSGVLITRNREVRHYFGDVSKYFTAPQGRADHDFLSLFSGDLKLAVSTTLQRALSQNEAIRSEGVSCTTRHGDEVIDIVITPYRENERDLGLLLVTLECRNEPDQKESDQAGGVFRASEETQGRILMLEDELRSTKENLQATVEELQTSNEELQAINEEIQVSNEELQSTNEELHSMNEELYTVNTELEQKNLQLSELNEEHEGLLSNTEDGIVYIDREKRIRKFNPTSRFAFNLLPQDIGRPIEHIAYNFEGQADMLQDVERVLETGQRSEGELRTQTGLFYLRRFTPFHDRDGGIAGVILTFTDVTEASQMRARLARAMKTSNMAWWEWNLQTDRLRVHAEGECILGYKCGAISNDSEFWFSRCHPDEVGWVRESLQDYLEGKTDEWICEHRYLRAGIEPVRYEWVLERGSITRRSPNGQPLEMSGTTMNIHSRKLLELDMVRAKEAADEALKVKSEFLSVMSHEIRTPLNGICGMAQLLDSELKKSEYYPYVEILNICSSSLLGLIDGILDYSKAGSGTLKLSSSPCDLRTLIEDVIRITLSQSENNTLTVTRRIDLPGDWFHLDEIRLRQVLVNIIGNAIKFSEGGGTIEIDLRLNREDKDQLECTVTDHGVGISPEFMARLFEPFSQQDGSSTRKFGGVGLGLSISKEIVSLMGGKIAALSNPETGTQFRFTIPAAPCDPPEQATDCPGVSEADLPPAPTTPASSTTVVIVDDDRANQIVLQKMIQRCGFEAVVAGTFEGALAAIRTHKNLRAVFLDLHMPDGSGHDLLNRIRSGEAGAQSKALPIYACTADASKEAREQVAASSFDGILVKPVRLTEIKKTLDSITEAAPSN